jgi:hypothetical protein
MKRSTVALLKIIAQAEADVAAGRLVSQEEAFERAAHVIDRIDGDRQPRSASRT